MTRSALLPPDWSTFIPDAIGALLTGVVVGAVIVIYERSLNNRSTGRKVRRARERAVESMVPRMTDPFAYSRETLRPDPTRIERVREAVAAVPEGRSPDVTPGYWMLLTILDQYDSMEWTAGGLRAALEERLGPDRDMLAEARGKVNAMAGDVQFRAAPTANTSPPSLPTNLFDEQGIRHAVDLYLVNRKLLDTARKAFLASDEHWRSEAWKIAIYEVKRSPVPLFPKWWRAWRARQRRAKARTAAESLAESMMWGAGVMWIPPRLV